MKNPYTTKTSPKNKVKMGTAAKTGMEKKKVPKDIIPTITNIKPSPMRILPPYSLRKSINPKNLRLMLFQPIQKEAEYKRLMENC